MSANAKLVRKATNMLFGFAREMPPEQAMAYIEARLPAVASLYGKVAAQAAIEAFEAQREAAQVEEPYEATYTAEVPESYVTEDLQAAAEKHKTGDTWDFDSMAANMVGHMIARSRPASPLPRASIESHATKKRASSSCVNACGTRSFGPDLGAGCTATVTRPRATAHAQNDRRRTSSTRTTSWSRSPFWRTRCQPSPG